MPSVLKPMSKSLTAGINTNGIEDGPKNFPIHQNQDSYPGEFKEQVQFPKRSSMASITTNSIKRTGKKIVDRAIPITTRQKRSRWIPGKRYFPLLFLQWLWHPIAALLARHQRAKERKLGSHEDPRHYFHDERHQHRSVEESQASIFADSGGDLFME